MTHLTAFVTCFLGYLLAYLISGWMFPRRGRFAKLKSHLRVWLFYGLSWIVMLIGLIISNGNPLPAVGPLLFFLIYFIWSGRKARRQKRELDRYANLQTVREQIAPDASQNAAPSVMRTPPEATVRRMR
ncbi:MAG: hypothetical protein AAF557_24970 [Pseudomonadota bacterium]